MLSDYILLWAQLLFWTVTVILGGYVTTQHWHESKWPKWLHKLPNALWTMIGLVLVAIGTLFSTYVWNEFATCEQRRQMREAVAAELVRNSDLLVKRYSLEWAEDPMAVQSREMPTMQTITLEAAIASGLFLDEKDSELLARIIDVRYLMSEFNRRLSDTHEGTARLNEEEFRAMLRSLPNKPRMVQLRKEIRDLATLLANKYDVQLELAIGLDGA